MSIQRYGPVWTGDESCSIVGNATGEYVLYADHVAAVAKAVKKADLTEAIIYHNRTEAYEQGILAERARIRQAIEGIANDDYCYDYDCHMKAKFLSIIDGEES